MKIDDFLNEVRGPQGYRLVECLVVNPYPVAEFFRFLAKELRPKHCIVLIDDGWPQVRINAVEDELHRRKVRATIHRVRAPEASGLVHAKIYFFHWENKTNEKHIRKLYLGSPNASPQGFGVHSETLAEVKFDILPSEIRKLAFDYFKSLSAGAEKTAETMLTTNDGVRIWLPAIHQASPNTPSFDSWVRTGRLCHRYSPDTGFGKLTVKLRKPLAKTEDEEVFAEQGFVRETRQEVLQRAYAGSIKTPDASPRWRSKYFVETDYGDWTSSDCFTAQLEGTLKVNNQCVVFQASKAKERSKVLETIRQADKTVHNKWIVDFGGALTKVVKMMMNRGLDPEEYLHFNSGRLDLSKYKQQWRDKLRSDKQRALIPEFYRRMGSGFAFPLVPPLGPSYEELVHSLCATVLRGALLLRRPNTLSRAIGDELGAERLAEIEDGAKMYRALLDLWEDDASRLRIMQFYLDESEEEV